MAGVAPPPLEHPWRAGLAGRGFAKAVRVSIDVEQTRNKDPQQMLNMFRRKCRQNNIHSTARAKRYHKKPTRLRTQRLNRCVDPTHAHCSTHLEAQERLTDPWPLLPSQRLRLSLPRRRVLHRVKGKVWNYLLTKQEKEWDDKYL